MTPRWRLFPKYALLIIALVGGLLAASGAIGLYFSWRDNEQHCSRCRPRRRRPRRRASSSTSRTSSTS
jgi:hypothetical protein